MLKKILLVTLVCILCFSMIACDGNKPTTVPQEDDTTNETPAGDDKPASQTQKPSAEKQELEWLNLATYNILHCLNYEIYKKDPKSADIIPDRYVEFAMENEIDILGLNEVDVNASRSTGFVKSEYCSQYGSNQPKYIAAKLTEKTGTQYYWAFAASLDGWTTAAHPSQGNAMYGNAIITRFPILSTRQFSVAAHEIDPDDPKTQIGPPIGGNYYERKTVLIAELDVNGTVVTVISAHFPLASDEQVLMMEGLLNELKTIETPVILMGDFNSGYDSGNIRQFNEILKPTATGSAPATFVSGSRIDYIYTSDDIYTKNLQSPQLPYSDHYPVIVDMALKPKES